MQSVLILECFICKVCVLMLECFIYNAKRPGQVKALRSDGARRELVALLRGWVPRHAARVTMDAQVCACLCRAIRPFHIVSSCIRHDQLCTVRAMQPNTCDGLYLLFSTTLIIQLHSE